MKFALGQQVLLYVGKGTREVVITGRAQYLRAATQYLVEDLDPDSKRGTFWVEEPGLVSKNAASEQASATDHEAEKRADRDRLAEALWKRHGLDYYDPKTHSLARSSAEARVDFTNAPRDWTPPKDAVPTSRGFFVGDRVIHPHYGGGLVTDNVNGHTEVRFYEQEVRTVFIGVRNDDLRLASIAESATAYPSAAAVAEKAVREAIADGVVGGLGKAVDRILATAREFPAANEIDAKLAEGVESVVGELRSFEGDIDRALRLAFENRYSVSISMYPKEDADEVASARDVG